MSVTPGTLPEAERRYLGLPRQARQGRLAGLGPRRAFVDLETTGFEAESDSIIEVGVVLVEDDVVIEEYTALVRPRRAIPPEIEAFTGITRAMVDSDGIEPDAAAAELAWLTAGAQIVAFNAPFEERFLGELSRLTGIDLSAAGYIDALELARIVLPRLRKHRQVDLCDFFGLETEPAHRALADARALAALFPILLAGVDSMAPETKGALAALSPTTLWPLRPLFATGGTPKRPDFLRWRRDVARPTREQCLASADDVVLTAPDRGRIAGRFAPDGALPAAGYETRKGQVEMALAVADAFTQRRHLVVEAGTGTGKSAAYLVPAIEFAVDNGVRVVISTHSTALQDQLVGHEIPRLADALGAPIQAVVLKGYDHYLCLRRFARLWDGEELNRASLSLAAMLTAWVADSAFDELDSLNVHSLMGLEGLVRASQASCLRDRCRFAREGTCFMWGQRRRAQAAHLLIVNHALLLANVRFGEMLYPSSRYLVVDEAHQLEDEAREALALVIDRQATVGVLSKLAGRGSRMFPDVPGVGPDDAKKLAERGAAASREARESMGRVKALFSRMAALGTQAGDAPPARSRSVWLSQAVRSTDSFEEARTAGGEALEALSGTIHALQLLLKDAALIKERTPDPALVLAEAVADLAGLTSELEEAALALETVLAGDDDALVDWLEIERRPGFEDEALVAAPLDVGEPLAQQLFGVQHSVVCTSATLSAGDDFAHFMTSVGLDRLERPPRRLAIPSPFDYAHQMGAFVPTDLPEPNAEGYLEALAGFLTQLHRAVGGGTLTLFTKRSDMESVHEVVEAELAADDLPVLCQGKGMSRRRLAEEFRADPRASLMATRSFWDGFDAPGETLRAVVIAKLPFGYLGDPLSEALRERLGWPRWWSDHYLPRAVLDLKQAAGRLIRSASDRGVVVLADSRLADRRYGRRFLAALPVPAALETSEDVVSTVRTLFESWA